jgi:hypothetical protein
MSIDQQVWVENTPFNTVVLVNPTTGEPYTAGGGGGGGGSGTEYTEDAALPANPAGGALIARRKDTPTASEVGADGDAIALNATAKGELRTSDADTAAAVSAINAKTPTLVNGHTPVAPSNVLTKFREAFEDYTPDGPRWSETVASGDFVVVDGNAVAASYLVISKDPLSAGTETSVETVATFEMPIDASIGMSMAQRTLGQEFSLEFVDTQAPLADVPDIAISSIAQTTTTLTIDTVTDHGLSVGKSIGVYGCSNPIANYPALVVASVPTPRQLTCTAGPNGTIASQTITNPTGAKGSIYFRERLGRAQNGLSMLLENNQTGNASFYLRSEAGDALPSGTIAGNHSVTIGSTTPLQLVNSPFQYAFGPGVEYRMSVQADRVQASDTGVDSLTGLTNRVLRTQVCPDPTQTYKFRIRATNNKALTVPSAQIVSATKSGTTTATIVTATAHNLALGDPVVIYGIRDQTATSFPNLLTASAVLSVIDATSFTIAQVSAGTVTSYGGYVAKVHGGNLMSALGASAVVAQNATLTTLTNGVRQLVLTGNTNWAGISIGDHVNLVGLRNTVNGASLGIDGVWKLANAVTTALTLVPGPGNTPPADFTITDCGGAVIKRTEIRISFARIFDYERQRVEIMARPINDVTISVPTIVTNVPGVTVSSGTVTTVSTVTALTGGGVAEDAAAGTNPVMVGGVVRAAVPPITFVAGDAVRDTMTTSGAKTIKPYSVPEADWTYLGAAAVANTTDVVLAAAAGASLRRYITALQIKGTNAVATEVVLKDGATVIWRGHLSASMLNGDSYSFPTPLKTTANAALNFACITTAAAVYVNAQGYTAP